MSAAAERKGGCLCGAVRYVLHGEPMRVGLCHCADCRKAGGSVFNCFGVWPRSAVDMSGHLSEFSGRSCCSTCGSRIGGGDAEEAEILLGTLDDAPTDLVPRYELWTGRREAWLHPLPWADQFAQDRTDDGGSWREARRTG